MNDSIICPFCGYDHSEEVEESLDDYVSEDTYPMECAGCEKEFFVVTHFKYSFTTLTSEGNK
jgi:hypothetical protein